MDGSSGARAANWTQPGPCVGVRRLGWPQWLSAPWDKVALPLVAPSLARYGEVPAARCACTAGAALGWPGWLGWVGPGSAGLVRRLKTTSTWIESWIFLIVEWNLHLLPFLDKHRESARATPELFPSAPTRSAPLPERRRRSILASNHEGISRLGPGQLSRLEVCFRPSPPRPSPPPLPSHIFAWPTRAALDRLAIPICCAQQGPRAPADRVWLFPPAF